MALMARDPSLRLRQAVQKNDLDLVMRLRYKTDLRNTDDKRLTSLAWSALSVSEEVYEWLLLDAGHDDDELSRDAENRTILHLLASLPSPLTPKSEKKVQEVYEAAVRMSNMYWDVFPDLIDWSDAAGKTALHMACQSGNSDLVQTLCELGADLQLTDLQGNTPLHYAAAWNNLPCIKVLLAFGSPSSSRNNDAFTALDYAYSTTLAREFALAIREVHEERKARRMYDGHNGMAEAGEGGGKEYFRTIGQKASFVSDNQYPYLHRGSFGLETPPPPPPMLQGQGQPPPMFQLTTPEPRSPALSVWSNGSDLNSRSPRLAQGAGLGIGTGMGMGMGARQSIPTTPSRRETYSPSSNSHSNSHSHSSPFLAPTPPLGYHTPSSSQRTYAGQPSVPAPSPYPIQGSGSARSSPTAGRSRSSSSALDSPQFLTTSTATYSNNSNNNSNPNLKRRPTVPALQIPGSTPRSPNPRSPEMMVPEITQVMDSPTSIRSNVILRGGMTDPFVLGRPIT